MQRVMQLAVYGRAFFNGNRCNPMLRSLNTVSREESEYSDTPEYPPITDLSRLGRKWSRHQTKHDQIKVLPTVEEKLLEMSKEQRSLFIFESLPFHSSSLPLRLYCTKTNLIHGLPAEYNLQGDAEFDAAYERMKPRFMAEIRHHFGGEAPLLPSKRPLLSDQGPREDDDRRDGFIAGRFFYAIFRIIVTEFSKDYQHLRENKIDYNPRVEAFWSRYGFHPSKRVIEYKKKFKKHAPHALMEPEELLQHNMQYIGNPLMQIRAKNPLPQFVGVEDPICAASNVESYPYSPRTLGYRYERRYPTSVAGVWPSQADNFDFGHLSVHTHHKMRKVLRTVHGIDEEELLQCLGLMTSFGSLLPLATYKGFTPFHELTYPMMTQTIVTDGIKWTFFTYQLNSICLGHYVKSNNYCNVCWTTKPARLFESVSHGQVVGLDDNILKTVVKFVLKKPSSVPEGMDLRPHLSKRTLNDKEWTAAVTQLRKFYSNRPPFKTTETFLWEKIYKKWFKSRILR